MPKLKSHKGLLKRIRVTGRGKVAFHKANSGHLRSGKGGKKLMSLRKKSIAKSGDMNRLEKMLHRPLKPSGALDRAGSKVKSRRAAGGEAQAATPGATKSATKGD
jgi:large subunit ribosomal protein L35